MASIDAGFPVNSTKNGIASLASIASGSITTPGANRLLVAICSWGGAGGANVAPLAISGASLTWTKIKEASFFLSGTGSSSAAIWYAFATSGVSAQTITVTRNGSDTASQDASLSIYSIAGANPTQTGVAVAGSSLSTGTPFSLSITPQSGSLVFWGIMDGDGGTLTAQSSNTLDNSFTSANFNTLGIGRYTGASPGGTLTVGCTGTSTFNSSVAAAEVFAIIEDFEQQTMGSGSSFRRPFPITALPSVFAPSLTTAQATIPPPSGPPRAVVLPERFLRTRWEPERTDITRAGWTQALWAIPPTWKPAAVLPETYLRPKWNPERTENDRAGWTQALWAVPPAKRPDPVLPESFARPAWSPERSSLVWPPRLVIVVPPWGYEMLGPQRFFPAWNPERSHSVGIPYLPPTWPTTVVVPERFARTAWNPERSHNAGIPYLPPTWPTTVVVPESFARPRWNPERTEAARAGWTQALWAVAPQKIPEPVLPSNYARPSWNPDRTYGVAVSFIIPPIGISVVAPDRFPPLDLRERSAVLVPPFIVQVPLLSWTPALLDRYVQALRSNPWLDFFFPPQVQAARPQLVVLVGRQDATATSGQQDTISFLGQRDFPTVRGFQDAITLLGLQAMTAFRGQQDPSAISARLDPAGLAGSQDAPTTVVSSRPPIVLLGQQDAITVLGRLDTGPLSGSQ